MVDRAAAAMALRERVRPVTLAKERLLAAPEPLQTLLPHGGLQRGTVISIGGAASSLALALIAPAVAAGSWAAAVGLPRLGLAAAEELGIAMERLLLVDPVPAGQWPAVVAALAESIDVVLVGPPSSSIAAGMARRVAARVREQGCVLVQVGWPARAWPDRTELTLEARPLQWAGIGAGHGHLRARQVEISVGGRRGADRGRRLRCWLPDEGGRLATVASPVVPVTTVPAVPAAPSGGGARRLALLPGPSG